MKIHRLRSERVHGRAGAGLRGAGSAGRAAPGARCHLDQGTRAIRWDRRWEQGWGKTSQEEGQEEEEGGRAGSEHPI